MVFDASGNNITTQPAAVYRYSKISKPQASAWTVSTEKASYTYTGEAIIPELIVKDGTKELEKDVDYEIKSIANGTNVGTATVTIVGKGDYDNTSTTTTTFMPIRCSTARNEGGCVHHRQPDRAFHRQRRGKRLLVAFAA